MHKMRYFY